MARRRPGGPAVFSAKIVPIPAFGTKRVETQYQERIPVENLQGLPGPSGNGSRIGRGSDWPLPPLALLNAYRELQGYPVIHKGMEYAVLHGTAKLLGVGLLAKTGTSACSHPRKGAGDGYVIVLLPESKPEWALLVRVHGTTGAKASQLAAGIVRTIREGK